MQQASEQRPHKLSYHLDKAAVGDPEAYLQQLAAALAAVGLGVNVVYSGGRDVDLLALGADKGRALAFLLQQIPAGCQPPLGCQVCAIMLGIADTCCTSCGAGKLVQMWVDMHCSQCPDCIRGRSNLVLPKPKAASMLAATCAA
jgi:hypothetical protein